MSRIPHADCIWAGVRDCPPICVWPQCRDEEKYHAAMDIGVYAPHHVNVDIDTFLQEGRALRRFTPEKIAEATEACRPADDPELPDDDPLMWLESYQRGWRFGYRDGFYAGVMITVAAGAACAALSWWIIHGF